MPENQSARAPECMSAGAPERKSTRFSWSFYLAQSYTQFHDTICQIVYLVVSHCNSVANVSPLPRLISVLILQPEINDAMKSDRRREQVAMQVQECRSAGEQECKVREQVPFFEHSC